jgi:hypothetical protein
MKQIAKDFVETTQAAKTSCQGNFSHRHPRLMNELLGKEHASCLGYSNRGGAKMLFEQTTELALSHAKAFGQFHNAAVATIQGAVRDQS